jgi:hypothetical protein
MSSENRNLKTGKFMWNHKIFAVKHHL